MKSPRNTGLLLMLATVLTVTLVAAPRASTQPSLSGAGQLTPADTDAGISTVSRKGCKFGQRYSSYYRRCVLWLPADFG